MADSDDKKIDRPMPAVDGQFRLKISPDKMFVHMEPLQESEQGDCHFEIKKVHENLKRLRVKYGVDDGKIADIVAVLNEGQLESKGDDSDFLCVARGTAPVDGDNASLKWHIDEDNLHDYVALPGELLATYTPLSKGEAGKNIFATGVMAVPGIDDTMKFCDGVDSVTIPSGVEYRSRWLGALHSLDGCISIDSPISIVDDDMSVVLDLYPPYHSEPKITSERIIEMLSKEGITFGVNEEELTSALVIVNDDRQPVLGLLAALGQPALHGSDAKIKWIISPDVLTSKGCVFRPGDIVAIRTPVTPAQTGKNIYGTDIPATAGDDISLLAGDNIIITEVNGECEYHATVFGVLNYESDDSSEKININPGLNVTADVMEVSLNLCAKSAVGVDVKVEDITKTLEKFGIIFGVDEVAIKNTLNFLKDEAPDTFETVIVARGRPSKDGIDAHIVYTQSENIGGQSLSHGRIDFREHNYPWSFNKGDSIGRLFKIKSEQDGCTVKGDVIKPMPANDKKFDIEGAHYDSHNRLIADIDGTLIINGLKLSLVDLYVINDDICQKTGNIHSKNDIHVKGHVEPGFKLESTKSIIIDKNIEDAMVQAGGSITVKGGVRGLSSEIYAPGDICANFIENADVCVNGDVTITGSIINSSVSSNGIILAGSEGEKHCAVIGGLLSAHIKIEAFILGSKAYPKTTICVGFTQEAKQQQRDLKTNIRAKENELIGLEQIEARNKRNHKNITKELLKKIDSTREFFTQELNVLNEQLLSLLEKIKKTENVRVIVHTHVFPGVVIKINEHIYKVSNDLGAGTFTVENDAIIFRADKSD